MSLSSVLYDGGGTDNALQLEADSAAVVAGGAQVIPIVNHGILDLQIVNAAAGESCTLWVSEFSAETPTVATQTHQVDVTIPTDDLAGEVDLSMVGLAATTGYAKAHKRVRVTPGHYVMISLAAQSASGAKYLRYILTSGELDADVDAEIAGTGLATSALQTTGNGLLATIDADTSIMAPNSIASTALLGTIDADTGAIKTAVEKSTADVTSAIYDGGGTTNALQTDTSDAAVVAGGAAVIDADGRNVLELFLLNSTASQSATLQVSEYSAATPTVQTLIRKTEVAIPVTDQTGTVDRAIVGLADDATEYAPKNPVRVAVTPGAYVVVSVSASLGGTWYALYTLHGST